MPRNLKRGGYAKIACRDDVGMNNDMFGHILCHDLTAGGVKNELFMEMGFIDWRGRQSLGGDLIAG